MILGFNKRFPEKIINGTKIHTFREDKNNRWKSGRVIHFATGVRTKNYHQFMVGECKSTQEIEIYPFTGEIVIDGKGISVNQLYEVARNDGFDQLQEFFNWFNQNFSGKIIHWTDYRY